MSGGPAPEAADIRWPGAMPLGSENLLPYDGNAGVV